MKAKVCPCIKDGKLRYYVKLGVCLGFLWKKHSRVEYTMCGGISRVEFYDGIEEAHTAIIKEFGENCEFVEWRG